MIMHYDYDQLYQHYYSARAAGFQNAQGKLFVVVLLKFLLPDPQFQCRLSTSPSGDLQPGSLRVIWVVTPSLQRAAAADVLQPEVSQERIADVVVRYQDKWYAVVVELKSEHSPYKPQLLEQLVGLLHSAQHMMLGRICCPDKVHPILLTKSANGISLKHLAALQLNTRIGLQTLATLVIAVARACADK